jgi:peptide/nickel transport system permease protein
MLRFFKNVRYVLSENPLSLMAAVLLFVVVLTAIVGPYLVPYDPYASNTDSMYQAPGYAHWFGTDQLGRDIFSRVVVATRLDLWIALVAVAFSFAVGSSIGGISGFVGGRVDRVIGRFVDVLMAFPLFVLAMALVAALGNKVENIILATAIINLPFYIRLSRAEVNLLRNLTYVDAARVSGNSKLDILFRILLPNALPSLMVQLSVNFGWAILNAAGLSFIGLGVRPPTAEWGIMVSDGAKDIISGYWWTGLFPGLALTLTVFCFNILGDSLRDLADPRKRS